MADVNEGKLEAADAVQKIGNEDRAAAMDMAKDLVIEEKYDLGEVVEAGDPNAESDEKAEPKAKPEAKVEETATEDDDAPVDDLVALAAQKRAERQRQEVERGRAQRERDLDEERREFDRERRHFEQQKERLKADPFAFAEKELGLDRSAAAERLVAGTLRPKEAQLEEALASQAAEIRALRERYETDTSSRAQREQQAQQQAHLDQIYTSWDTVSGDRERYPRVARLPPEVRRRYGDHVANLLTEAGRPWTQETIAKQIEHELSKDDEPAGAPGKGKGGETAAANGAGKKKPPATLTNDLASQSAGTTRDLLDDAGLRRSALRELVKSGWGS